MTKAIRSKLHTCSVFGLTSLLCSGIIGIVSSGGSYAQDRPPEQPPRDKFFWCQQQRNFFADNAAVNAAEAAKLQEENEKLKAELAALKKAAPEVSKAQ